LHIDKLQSDPDFSTSILTVASKEFSKLDASTQAEVVETFRLLRCIPTTQAMQLPGACYFSQLSFFSDIPIVTLKPSSVNKKFITALGVRHSVSLQLILERLDTLCWDNYKLVNYLSSIETEISPLEWQILREKSFLLEERAGSFSIERKRMRASELAIPTDKNRAIGCSLLEWSRNWRASSSEALLLKRIGLMDHPRLEFLLTTAARLPSQQAPLTRENFLALNYLLANFSLYKQHYNKSTSVKFIPCSVEPDVTVMLYSPSECYCSPEARLFGLPVVLEVFFDSVHLLGVRSDPPGALLVECLSKRRLVDHAVACRVFSYLASCANTFSSEIYKKFFEMEFVPLDSPSGDSLVYGKPSEVYFDLPDEYKDLFPTVDFGAQGNTFLRLCGAKDRPTVEDLALKLTSQPEDLFRALGGPCGYLAVVRELSVHFRQFSTQLLSKLSSSRCLLAWKTTSEADDLEASLCVFYELCCANECVIADEAVIRQLFNPLSAPSETTIELFYHALGARYISREATTTIKLIGKPIVDDTALALKSAILQRLPLLQYAYSQSHGPGSGSNFASLQGLEVRLYKHLKKEMTFRGKTKHQPTTAAPLAGLTLAATAAYDYHDVATALTFMTNKKTSPNDALLFAALLATPLIGLKAKGYPIERLLQVRPSESATHSVETPKDVFDSNTSLDNSFSRQVKLVEKLKKKFSKISKDELLQLLMKFKDYNEVENYLHSFENAKKPQTLAGNLFNAIRRCRPHNKRTVDNEPRRLIRPTAMETTCEVIPANHLTFLREVEGIELYVSRGASDSDVFANSSVCFSHVLKQMGNIYQLPPRAIHMFLGEENSTVVAFNNATSSGYSLFFNLNYFHRLHYNEGRRLNIRCYFYWYLVYAHELAHCFEPLHNQQFITYFGAFAEEFYESFLAANPSFSV
jgi:hypothetical protein